MAKYKIELSLSAENDMRDIVRYISSQLSAPLTASHMMDLLEEAIFSLTDYPKKCPPVGDDRLNAMGYRKLIVKNYIVFILVDEATKEVSIERILYARRDWLRFL